MMAQTAAAERQPLNVLIVEDSAEDAELLVLELRRGGYEPRHRRVDTAHELEAALEERQWDMVLSDYSMPRLTLAEALAMVRQRGLDLPFVIVSATIGEEAAVSAMKAGAHDYVLKHKLGRLVPAVERELRDHQTRRERQKLEQQLQHAQKLESLGLLAGGVAHDFNNLLTGIMGNASLVAEVWSPPHEAQVLLDEVVRAAERAADLTRQLLAYAGKGRFIVEPIDLAHLVEEIAALVSTSIPKKVRLHISLHNDLPAVEADSSQIQQLMMNLVLNAAEAIGAESGMVLVTAGVRQLTADRIRHMVPGNDVPPGEYVYVEVQDTGCGMDEEIKAHIFDPFFTTKFTGRGLGLAAALGIVRGHRGAIHVESWPGKGSKFEVYFPAAARKAAAPREYGIPGGSRADVAGVGAVLVIDDEPVVRQTARAALEHYGYTVLEAENGETGVAIFRKMSDAVQCVLLDLTMPVMGGEEAFERIKEIRPEVEVILSSGYDEQEAARRFAGKGIEHFIQKPYTSFRLAELVKNVVHGKRRKAG